jgi:hypothetical protein
MENMYYVIQLGVYLKMANSFIGHSPPKPVIPGYVIKKFEIITIPSVLKLRLKTVQLGRYRADFVVHGVKHDDKK